jgi:hypothetical protein
MKILDVYSRFGVDISLDNYSRFCDTTLLVQGTYVLNGAWRLTRADGKRATLEPTDGRAPNHFTCVGAVRLEDGENYQDALARWFAGDRLPVQADLKTNARQRMLLLIPHIRHAIEEARTRGKVELGILAVDASDGGGRVMCRFDAEEFFEDLAQLVGAATSTCTPEEGEGLP